MGIGKLEVGLFSICFWSITSDNLSKGNPFMRIIKFYLFCEHGVFICSIYLLRLFDKNMTQIWLEP